MNPRHDIAETCDKKVAVVVADDDDDVRDYFADVLEGGGYEVLSACNGFHALDIIRRRRDVRVLLTDIRMPQMDGFSLARQARDSRPDLEVVYASGYAASRDSSDALVAGSRMLAKPCKAAAILDAMAAVLGR